MDKWLTIEELALYLKMSRTKLYQMAQASKIPASKVGSQWRFDRDRIDLWMNESMSSSRKQEFGERNV